MALPSLMYVICLPSPTLLYSLFSSAGLWHPRLGLVAGIWASRTVQYLAPTLLRALQLLIYSSIPTNNRPAITNTNRYNKVRVCVCVRALRFCVHVWGDRPQNIWHVHLANVHDSPLWWKVLFNLSEHCNLYMMEDFVHFGEPGSCVVEGKCPR